MIRSFVKTLSFLVLTTCAAPVMPGPHPHEQAEIEFEEVDSQHIVGYIHWNNKIGGGACRPWDFYTSEGTFTLKHCVSSNRTEKYPNCCPDTLEVINWPPHTYVEPKLQKIHEGSSISFTVYRYIGG